MKNILQIADFIISHSALLQHIKYHYDFLIYGGFVSAAVDEPLASEDALRRIMTKTNDIDLRIFADHSETTIAWPDTVEFVGRSATKIGYESCERLELRELICGQSIKFDVSISPAFGDRYDFAHNTLAIKACRYNCYLISTLCYHDVVPGYENDEIPAFTVPELIELIRERSLIPVCRPDQINEPSFRARYRRMLEKGYKIDRKKNFRHGSWITGVLAAWLDSSD